MERVSRKKEPLISIIIPIYNGEKYIQKTLDKLTNINSSKEIIVINDCSSDNSLDLLNKYKKNIILINLKENQGVSNARNLGIQKASGKYVGFVDVDDSFENEIFEKMLSKIEKTNSDVCICNYDEFFEINNIITKSKYVYENETLNQNEALSNYLIDNISPAIWDKIYKTEIVKDIKFNKDLAIGEDILFCLNVFIKCKSFSFVNEYLYHYLQQSNSVMHTVSPKLLQFRDVILNIEAKDREYLEKNYSEEFNFFKLEMITRGIHSLSSICNKKNKNQVIRYLKTYCGKNDLKKILKNKYYSKTIKLEILILKTLGVKFHLFMTPIYKIIRNKIR